MLTVIRMLLKMLVYPFYQKCKEPFNYKIVKQKEYFPKLNIKIECRGTKDLAIERTDKQAFEATLYNGFRSGENGKTYVQSGFQSHKYKGDDLPFFLALVATYHLHSNIKNLNGMFNMYEDKRIMIIKKIFNLLLLSQKKYILNQLSSGESSPLSYPSPDSIEAKYREYEERISKNK